MKKCQTGSNPAPAPTTHTHKQKLYSLSLGYYQNLAQCLAQADAQKLLNKSTSSGLNVNLKRSSASDEIKTTEPVVWFCRLLSIREGSVRFNQENKSAPDRDHKGYVPCTLRLSKSRIRPGDVGKRLGTWLGRPGRGPQILHSSNSPRFPPVNVSPRSALTGHLPSSASYILVNESRAPQSRNHTQRGA